MTCNLEHWTEARVRRLKKRITNDKCNYILPPFSAGGFDPDLHNTYIRNQRRNSKEVKVLQCSHDDFWIQIMKQEEEDKKIQRELDNYERVEYIKKEIL